MKILNLIRRKSEPEPMSDQAPPGYRTVTLYLPEDVYHAVRAAARSTNQPARSLILQWITDGLNRVSQRD